MAEELSTSGSIWGWEALCGSSCPSNLHFCQICNVHLLNVGLEVYNTLNSSLATSCGYKGLSLDCCWECWLRPCQFLISTILFKLLYKLDHLWGSIRIMHVSSAAAFTSLGHPQIGC